MVYACGCGRIEPRAVVVKEEGCTVNKCGVLGRERKFAEESE